MKILVTGASGFLGRTLCIKLDAQGHEIVKLNSKNCDLTEMDSLRRFNHSSYDQIYHLAAWTQAGEFCLHHPGEQWIINQQINTHVLSWWKDYQPQAKLICIGSSCAYAPEVELVEENYLVGSPIESLLTYAMTKRMLYLGLLALYQQFGLKYLYLVPSTLYGPAYHTDNRQMHFIFDLIRKVIRGKVCGEPVVLWGDGYQRRELVFVDDCAEMILKLVATCETDIINIGSGEAFTIRHFAKQICDRVGYNFDAIVFDKTRYVGARNKCLTVKKWKCLLPDFELTSLDVGLSKTIDWFWAEREKLLANGT